MRILYMIPDLGLGGAERLVSWLAPQLKRWGHTVSVVSQYNANASPLESSLAEQGVQLGFLGKRKGLDLRMVPRIAREIRAFGPDVVHSHSPHVLRYLFPAALAARGGAIVHTVHNLAEHETSGPGRLLQYVAFRAGVVAVGVGETVAASVQRVYRLQECRYIANGIPVSEFSVRPSGGPERRGLGIPAGVPVFVHVGRFSEQKNHLALLTAFASSRLQALDAHLVLVGDGHLRSTMEAFARDRGIAERVRFLGRRHDIVGLLHLADAFVLSSTWEGNPLSVMEAMAAGLPVVATSVGGVPEIVSMDTGELVPPGNLAALEGAMYSLASDLALAQVKGASAARVAATRFDATIMARAYERLYAELIGYGAT